MMQQMQSMQGNDGPDSDDEDEEQEATTDPAKKDALQDLEGEADAEK